MARILVLSCACYVLRRCPVLYDAALPLFCGKVALEKMTLINTFGPVLKNDRCIGYTLADRS